MNGRWRTPATIVALLAATACSDRGDEWERALGLTGPVQSGDHLVWVRTATADLIALDMTERRPAQHVEIGELTRAIAAVPEGVLLCGGRGDAPWIRRVTLASGESFRYEPAAGATAIGAYDRIAVDPDGRHAVLFYDPSRPPATGGPAARNNNEIAVVDLSAGTVRAVALQTESLAPKDVVFTRGIAAVVMDNTIVLVDLANPTARVRVPLAVSPSQSLTPLKAVFAPDGAFLYVQTDGANDVLAIEVHRSANELGASVNFLFHPGAVQLQDIAVPEGPGFERYVAAIFGGSAPVAALLDATGDAARTRSVQLTRVASRIFDLGEGLLLLNGLGTEQARRSLAAWDPLGERLDEASLPGVPSQHVRQGSGVVFFAHPAVGLGEGVSAALTAATIEDQGARLRLRQNTLVLGGEPTATALDPASNSLFVALTVPRKDSGAAPRPGTEDDFSGTTGTLVRVRADDFSLSGTALDQTIKQVGVAGDHLFALHPSALGDLTSLPIASLDRADAFRHAGFLAGRLFGAGGQ